VDIQKSFLDIQNNYFRYLKTGINVNSAYHSNQLFGLRISSWWYLSRLSTRKHFISLKFPHHCLLMKLQAHGIGGNVLQWIGNWLSGRKQRVILGGQVSDWCKVVFTGYDVWITGKTKLLQTRAKTRTQEKFSSGRHAKSELQHRGHGDQASSVNLCIAKQGWKFRENAP